MKYLKKTDPEIFQAVLNETKRQKDGIELIASENFTSRAVMEAVSSAMTNKYAEGYPHARYYGGCEFVDHAEDLAIERANATRRQTLVSRQTRIDMTACLSQALAGR